MWRHVPVELAVILCCILCLALILFLVRPRFVAKPGSSPERPLWIRLDQRKWERGRFYHVSAEFQELDGWKGLLGCMWAKLRAGESISSVLADRDANFIFLFRTFRPPCCRRQPPQPLDVGEFWQSEAKDKGGWEEGDGEDEAEPLEVEEFWQRQRCAREESTGACIASLHAFMRCPCGGPPIIEKKPIEKKPIEKKPIEKKPIEKTDGSMVVRSGNGCGLAGLCLEWSTDWFGGSAGLSDALSLVVALCRPPISRNLSSKRIGATGTVDPDGRVGPIGCAAQKTISAERNRLDILLMHPDNVPDAARHAKRLRIIPVATLEEAVAALGAIK